MALILHAITLLLLLLRPFCNWLGSFIFNQTKASDSANSQRCDCQVWMIAEETEKEKGEYSFFSNGFGKDF